MEIKYHKLIVHVVDYDFDGALIHYKKRGYWMLFHDFENYETLIDEFRRSAWIWDEREDQYNDEYSQPLFIWK